uniref:Uncharacterized protein n=1 Tax=Oryza glumipatula TaxID=40148 RepID=A0A0E0AV75_9ORYZ
MASLYTPHLTRWHVATSDGDELDCVDYKVRSLIFQCEDCHRLFPDYKEDTHECRQGVLTDGREDGTGVARQRLSWDGVVCGVRRGRQVGVAADSDKGGEERGGRGGRGGLRGVGARLRRPLPRPGEQHSGIGGGRGRLIVRLISVREEIG